MPLYKNKYRTDSIRLKGWDYRTSAWYFITICTKNRCHFFGEIRNKIMGLSFVGNRAHLNWQAIPDHFDHIKLDVFIVMPNHTHGLIGITKNPAHTPLGSGGKQTREFGPLQSGSISSIMQAYKASVTRWCRKKGYYEFGWQSKFYDHIVRDKEEFQRIRNYIINNPAKWQDDRYYG